MPRPQFKKLAKVEPAAEALRLLESNVDDAFRQAGDNFEEGWDVADLVIGDTKAKVGQLIPCNPEKSGFTVLLPKPSAAQNGKRILILNVTSNTNTVNITGADCTVRGVATATLSGAYWSQKLVAYGGNWWLG